MVMVLIQENSVEGCASGAGAEGVAVDIWVCGRGASVWSRRGMATAFVTPIFTGPRTGDSPPCVTPSGALIAEVIGPVCFVSRYAEHELSGPRTPWKRLAGIRRQHRGFRPWIHSLTWP